MADKPPSPDPQPSGGGGSWWGGWLQTVKSSTQSLVNMYKEDLSEFGRVVATDTKAFVGDVSKKIEDVSKQRPSSFTTTVTTTLATGVTEVTGGIKSLVSTISETVSANVTSPHPAVSAQTSLEQLQTTSTFESNPDDAEFENWLNEFQVDSKKDEIAKILATSQPIFEMYQQLVPTELSSQEFWGRYFFRLEKMQEKEARRVEMLKKAQELAQEEISWDDDEAAAANTAPAQEPTANSSIPAENPSKGDEGEVISIPDTDAEPGLDSQPSGHINEAPPTSEKVERSATPPISQVETQEPEAKVEELTAQPSATMEIPVVVASPQTPPTSSSHTRLSAPAPADEDDVFEWE